MPKGQKEGVLKTMDEGLTANRERCMNIRDESDHILSDWVKERRKGRKLNSWLGAAKTDSPILVYCKSSEPPVPATRSCLASLQSIREKRGLTMHDSCH